MRALSVDASSAAGAYVRRRLATSARSSPTRCGCTSREAAPTLSRQRGQARARSLRRPPRRLLEAPRQRPRSAGLLAAAERRPEDLEGRAFSCGARRMPLCMPECVPPCGGDAPPASTRRAAVRPLPQVDRPRRATSRWRSAARSSPSAPRRRSRSSRRSAYGVRYNYGLEGKRADWSRVEQVDRSRAAAPTRRGVEVTTAAPSATSTRGSCARRCSRCRWAPPRRSSSTRSRASTTGGVRRQVLRGEARDHPHRDRSRHHALGGNQFFEESAKFYAPKPAARQGRRQGRGRRRRTAQQPVAVEADVAAAARASGARAAAARRRCALTLFVTSRRAAIHTWRAHLKSAID